MDCMKTKTLPPPTEGAIWEQIVEPETGDLAPEAARLFLRLDFHSNDRELMDELAEKARAGRLTPQETRAAETYNRVAHLLALLQSKARRSLRSTGKKS